MRVIVTGAAGQVGRELLTAFADHDVLGVGHSELDVTRREDVLAFVTAAQPDAVVHAAAWTAVDACEGDPDRAYAANALGTRNVAEAARRVGAHLTTFSTDYVFDGTKPRPYLEWDEPNPQSVYGRSKLAGEREAASYADSLVLRISWVCGQHGSNMVKTILRLASQHPTLQFVDDQRGQPTFAADAAAGVRRMVADRRVGTYHMTNQGAVSWYEFARAVLEAAGDDPGRVEPIRSEDLRPARPAPRPANSVLDNAALRMQGLPLLPDYHESLARLVATLPG